VNSKNDMKNVENLLKALVQSLVTNPHAVTIQSREDSRGRVYLVSLDPSDAGGVIGRYGVVVKSIRTIIRSAGYNMENIRCSVVFDLPA